jgi:hypothetical protein
VANENQQNDVQQPAGVPPIASVTDAALGARGASRRRFARAGAGVTGVLLTLASHPGMACSVNQGPSGWHSANTAKSKGMQLSHTVTAPSSGLPPSTWCTRSSWPCNTSVRFGSVFNCNSSNTAIRNATLMAHCAGRAGTSGDKGKIAMLLSAAYLNVLSRRSPFLTQQTLNNIWTEYQSKGTYTPMAGVTPWNAVTIVTYLTGTMD